MPLNPFDLNALPQNKPLRQTQQFPTSTSSAFGRSGVGKSINSLLSIFGADKFITTPAEAQSTNRKAVANKLAELQATGANPHQIVSQLFTSPEFINAFSQDQNIGAYAAQLIKQISSNPGDVTVGQGDTIVRPNAAGGYDTARPPTPHTTPQEQLVNDIILAKKKGDTQRAELLLRTLPHDPNGMTPASSAVKLRAAGLVKTGNQFVDKMSPEQAKMAVGFGAPGSHQPAVAFNDLLLRSFGKETNNPAANKIDKDAALAMLKVRQEVMGSQDFISSLFKSMSGEQGGSGAPSIGGGGNPQDIVNNYFSTHPQGQAAPTAGQIQVPTTAAQINNMTPEQRKALAQDVIDKKVSLPQELWGPLIDAVQKDGS